MKNKYFIILTLIILSLSACHENYFDSDYPCAFCYNIKPDEGILFINLTINQDHKSVPIMIFRDVIENGDTIWMDTAYETPYDIGVSIDNNYTVTAEYQVGNKKVIAVDNDRVFMRKNTADCDEECWIIFDGEVDVRLKYE